MMHIYIYTTYFCLRHDLSIKYTRIQKRGVECSSGGMAVGSAWCLGCSLPCFTRLGTASATASSASAATMYRIAPGAALFQNCLFGKSGPGVRMAVTQGLFQNDVSGVAWLPQLGARAGRVGGWGHPHPAPGAPAAQHPPPPVAVRGRHTSPRVPRRLRLLLP